MRRRLLDKIYRLMRRSLLADDLTSAGLQALREEVSTVRCKVRTSTLL